MRHVVSRLEGSPALLWLSQVGPTPVILMNSSAFIITLVGTLASIVVVVANLILLVTTRKRKKDLILFYFRFHVDVIFGLSYFLYSFFILGFAVYETSFFIDNSTLFWLGLPFSNASAGRTFLVLIIVLDRVLATYLPIKYHIIRPRVPNFWILITPLLFTLTEDFVIFGICGRNSDPIPDTCVAFPCTLNKCGYSWWTSYKSVVFPIIILLTIVLCVKLMAFSKRLHKSGASTRANRLALLDAFLIFFFDFVPSFLANQFPNSPLIAYTTTGPVTAMLKEVGRAVESLIVIEILVRRAVGRVGDNGTRGKRSTQQFPAVLTQPSK